MWFSLWAIQKLSKPQHARQMHEMFGCQMTLVIFVVLWSVPAPWNDNRGLFDDFHASRGFFFFGLWQNVELNQGTVGICRGLIVWRLHFGCLARSCGQIYRLWWGGLTYDPLLMWDNVQNRPCKPPRRSYMN